MAKLRKKIAVLSLGSLFMLSACQQPGQDLRPDSYDASSVNTVQRGRIVTILSVSPAKITVDNSHNQKTATVVGGILGTALGVGLAGGVGHAGWGGDTAAGIGGALAGGALAHSVAGAKTQVNGVSIGYQDRAGGDVLFSAQVGRTCEYKPGTAALITMGNNQTRVQPNAVCPSH